VAGATQRTSASSASSMWGWAPGPKVSMRTGRLVRASKVLGPTSLVAQRVMTTVTPAPAWTNWLTRAALL